MASVDGKAKFLKTLSDALAAGTTVAVYADCGDFQNFEVGFVEFVDDEEVVLACLTPRGEPDGRRAIRSDDVIRVDIDTAYNKKLELLYQYKESLFSGDFPELPSKSLGMQAQLEHARDNLIIVHVVDSHDYGPTGFVRSIGDDFVEVERISSNGEPDGIATILMAGIVKVHFGRRQEQTLNFLYRHNFGLRKLLGS